MEVWRKIHLPFERQFAGLGEVCRQFLLVDCVNKRGKPYTSSFYIEQVEYNAHLNKILTHKFSNLCIKTTSYNYTVRMFDPLKLC